MILQNNPNEPVIKDVKSWVAVETFFVCKKPSQHKNKTEKHTINTNRKKLILLFTIIYVLGWVKKKGLN